MSLKRAAISSLILLSVSACAQTPQQPSFMQPPLPVTGGGAGGASGSRGGAGGGAITPPIGGAGTTGTVAGTAGGAGASGGASASGGAGGSSAQGIAGMYADEYPPCDDAAAQLGGMSASAGSGGGAGSGGAAGSASAGSGGAGGSRGAAGSASAGSGGAGGATGAATSGTPATFSEVYNLITCKTCSLCHGASAGLAFTGGKSATYEALLGSDLLGKPTGTATDGGMCTGQRRVVPGMPDQSLLYLKVAGMQKCGAIMPPAPATALTAAQVERFRSWIMAGAKKN